MSRYMNMMLGYWIIAFMTSSLLLYLPQSIFFVGDAFIVLSSIHCTPMDGNSFFVTAINYFFIACVFYLFLLSLLMFLFPFLVSLELICIKFSRTHPCQIYFLQYCCCCFFVFFCLFFFCLFFF